MPLDKRLGADGICRPADDRRERHQVAHQTARTDRRSPPDDEVDPGKRQRRACPVRTSEFRVSDQCGADGNDHRTGGDDERAVRDARACQSADEQDLISEVTDDPQPGECPPVAPCESRRGVEHPATGCLRSAGTGRGHRRQKDQRRQRRPHRVECLRVDLRKRGFDDGVIGAPDENHQEQKGVGAGKTAEWQRRRRGQTRDPTPAPPRSVRSII